MLVNTEKKNNKQKMAALFVILMNAFELNFNY